MKHARALAPGILAAVWFPFISPAPAADPGPAFPLRSSDDGRYLVDQEGRPFFYHADTAWTIAKKLAPAEVEEYLDDRKRKGFTAIHVHTFSKEQGPMRNREGHEPFSPADDILKPNEPYWRNLDSVLEAARARGLAVSLAAIWIRWGGKDREGWRYQLTDENARAYGEFLGRRYRRLDHLIWILGGDANPIERSGAIAAIAAGIREHAPRQLITVHNAPENASAAFFHGEPWLGINLAYTYRDPYLHVLGEYHRRPPVRPIVLGESGYELESNDGRGGETIRVRRQAYWAVLSGALGGHAYGHKHIWRFDADWRKALDSPGAVHMTHVKSLFAARAWHKLVPDAHGRLVTRGRGFFGDGDYAAAAVAGDRSFALVYLPKSRPITVDLARVRGPVAARWFDPTSGSYEAIALPPGEPGERELIPPEKNAAGDSDLVLVLESRAPPPGPLVLDWEQNYLTIRGARLPEEGIRVHYLEAYCRPNSHQTDWVEHTVIGHRTELLSRTADGREIKLRCTLRDGVKVDHAITAREDEVDFRLTARNPTDRASEAHWAQPCVRLGEFTGFPDWKSYEYLKKSFVFLDGKLATMPTKDWAKEARYTPGQVWAAPGVPGADVNPRPLSPHTPSNGLIGCFSADGTAIFATAWEPYQELFQGVAACLHSDFRLGGLKPGETKEVRGKIYIVPNDVAALLARYERDFPEQVRKGR